MKDKNITI